MLVAQSCPTLWDPMDCSPPGSFVRGILQTRILEWVAISLGIPEKTSTSALLTILKPLAVWINNKLWKILKEMGIPDHLTCLLRNLHAGPEATVRTTRGTVDWFKIGKGVHQGCILSLCLFSFYAEYILGNARLDESQAGIKIKYQ